MNETPLPDEVRILMAEHGYTLDLFTWRWGCPGKPWLDHAYIVEAYHQNMLDGVARVLQHVEETGREPG